MKPARVNLLPVRYPVYQAVSALNHSLEQAIENLEQLASFNFLRRDFLKAYQIMVEEIRALANHELMEIMSERELENMAYYEGLRLKWQNRFKDPSEVLFDAQRYKQQVNKGKKQPQSSKPPKKRSS